MGCLFAMTILIGGDAQLVPRAISPLPRVPMKSNHLSSVMPALVAGIHVFPASLQLKRRGWPGQARLVPAMTPSKRFNLTGTPVSRPPILSIPIAFEIADQRRAEMAIGLLSGIHGHVAAEHI